jgi:nucleotide-binding universal stress UspA family protein
MRSSIGMDRHLSEGDMIKSIFVPTSGSDTDDAVFATALAIARPLSAHLDFYHSRLTVYEAVARSLPVQFCVGPALTNALNDLRQEDEDRSLSSVRHFDAFCASNGIAVRHAPIIATDASAMLTQETDHTEERLLLNARHSDLVVLGRQRHIDRMPYNLIELLLLRCGRPVVIAGKVPPVTVTGTIVVGWKETPASARALGVAMPLLQAAQRVVLVNIAEERDAAPPELDHLVHRLAWHGIAAESRQIAHVSKLTPSHLLRIAEEFGADLLVTGGYGHGPLREAAFGGVTRALIEGAELPVLMMH